MFAGYTGCMDSIVKQRNLQASLDAVLGVPEEKFRAHGAVFLQPVGEQGMLESILAELSAWKKTRDEARCCAHVGAAGWFNFDAIAAGEHDVLLLVDCNREQIRFWKDFVQVLAKAESREALLEYALSHVKHGHWLTADGSANIPIKADSGSVFVDFLAKSRWFENEGSFERLRAMAREGHILALELDMYDVARCGKLRGWLDANGIEATSVYGSNIQDINCDLIKNAQIYKLYGEEMRETSKQVPLTTRAMDAVRRFRGHAVPPRSFDDVLKDRTQLIEQGIIEPKSEDFYKRNIDREREGFGLIANADDSRVYHTSICDVPMIVYEGKLELPIDRGSGIA